MAWIESHQQIERHPKTLRLMSLAKIDSNSAVGLLHRFWWWCLDYAQDGDLSKYKIEEIDQFIGPDATKALICAGWIDSEPYLRVHDWWDWSGMFWQSKYRHQPEKWKGIRDQYMSMTVSKTGYQTCTPNRPNLTNQPNLTKPNQTDVVAKAKAFARPSLEDLIAYCSERKNHVDPQRWLDHYESNGWRVGRNPMKDWKAAVRTWEKSSAQTADPTEQARRDTREYIAGLKARGL